MTANPDITPDPLDLYLDGMLEGDALAAFERRLSAEEALRRTLENHRTIDAGLKRVFKTPTIRVSLAEVEPPGPVPMATKPRSFKFPIAPRFLLYAAIIGIAVLVGWWQMLGPTSSGGPPRLSAGGVFANLTSKGFKPQFVCTTDEAFNETMTKRFGQGLLIASAPNIELIGWAYSDGYNGAVISTHELILMAKVDGKEAVVFMDRKRNEPWLGIKKEAPPGMRVFRREIGEYVLYELTSSPTGMLTERAYIPEGK